MAQMFKDDVLGFNHGAILTHVLGVVNQGRWSPRLTASASCTSPGAG
jgi:hypothetical protein